MTTQNIQTAQTAQGTATPVQTAPQSIHAKLMKVRTELRSGKDAHNSFGGYDYRNAESMLSKIKPVMERYGLTLDFSDEIVQIGTRYYVKSTVTAYDTQTGETHSTTQFAREMENKKGQDEAQTTGSTMTYCHKYALMGLLAISDPKMDPDSMDNTQTQGQTQFQPEQPARQLRPATPAPAPQGYNNGYGTYYGNNRAYRQA